MTKAELKYTGDIFLGIIYFIRKREKDEAKYRVLISLTLRRGDMEPARHLQVLLPNRRWMVPTKIANFLSITFPAFLPGEDLKALPPRRTNFSCESFRGKTFFISWLSGSLLMSRTVIWSLVLGLMMQNRWRIFAVMASFQDWLPLTHDIVEKYWITLISFIPRPHYNSLVLHQKQKIGASEKSRGWKTDVPDEMNKTFGRRIPPGRSFILVIHRSGHFAKCWEFYALQLG